MSKQKTIKKFKDSKDCEYCNMWKAYGSDADNAMLEKLEKTRSFAAPSYWNGKECHRLLKLLYLDEISIEEFKEMFTDAGMDYNQVKHCCGCAGCYKRKTHTCPDFDADPATFPGGDRPDCKIFDPMYFCDICGKPAKYGDIVSSSTHYELPPLTTTTNKGKKPYYDWLCKKHFKAREEQFELAEASNDDDDVLAKHIGI